MLTNEASVAGRLLVTYLEKSISYVHPTGYLRKRGVKALYTSNSYRAPVIGHLAFSRRSEWLP